MGDYEYGDIGFELGILEIGTCETIIKTVFETKRINGIKVTVSTVALVSVSNSHLCFWEKINSVVPGDVLFKLVYKKGFPTEKDLTQLSITNLQEKTDIFISQVTDNSHSEND